MGLYLAPSEHALVLCTDEQVQIHRRHQAVEFKKLLVRVDKDVPADLDVHPMYDNASTHKKPTIRRWLTARPRFHVHFTPTSSSWLNQVERWSALLTDNWVRRGAHKKIQALEFVIRS